MERIVALSYTGVTNFRKRFGFWPIMYTFQLMHNYKVHSILSFLVPASLVSCNTWWRCFHILDISRRNSTSKDHPSWQSLQTMTSRTCRYHIPPLAAKLQLRCLWDSIQKV